MNPDEADANLCTRVPFHSSAEPAQGWLAAHPGGLVFPVQEAWDLSFHRVGGTECRPCWTAATEPNGARRAVRAAAQDPANCRGYCPIIAE